eukprot:373652_1
MAHSLDTAAPNKFSEGQNETRNNEDAPDEALKAWISEYKLSKIANQLYEENVTLEFLLDQSEEDLKDIAVNDLNFTGIQLKKFLHAVSKHKHKQKLNANKEIQVIERKNDEKQDENKIQHDNIAVCDSWYNEIKGDYISISGRTCTMTKDGWRNSCYSAHVVHSGIYRWKLKVIATKWTEDLQIGIILDDAKQMNRGKNGQCDHNSSYMMVTIRGVYVMRNLDMTQGTCFMQYRGNSSQKSYGTHCSSVGNEIEVVLNLNDLTLSYVINGKDYGVMTKVDKMSYRLAVTLLNAQHSLQILSSQCQ